MDVPDSDARPSLEDLRSLHVVLIEDNPADARLFEEYVREVESDVVLRWTESLAAGLEAAEQEQTDVLVVDLSLPDSEGVETVDRCVAAVNVPVVVLTGSDRFEVALDALEAGASDFLHKDELSPRLAAHTLRWAVKQWRMERDLKRKDEWIQSVTANVATPIFRTTPEGDFLYANEAVAETFGFDGLADLLDTDVFDLYTDPSNRETFKQRMHDRGSVRAFEAEFQCTDGSTFTGLLTATTIYDDEGAVQYYDGVLTDITERKRRAERLRQYERMVNTMLEAAAIYNADAEFEVVNQYLAEWYGTSPEDLVGRESALVSLVRASSEGDPFQELLQGSREAMRGEVEGIFPGHGHAVLEYRLAPLSIEGDGTHVVGVTRDITERRDKEQRLRLLSEAVEQATEAVLITEADPLDEPGPRITYVNEAFTERTGYTEEEVLGETPRILQGPETDPEVVDSLRDALEAGEPWEGETVNYRKDGTPYVVQWNVAPVEGEDGAIEYWVSVQRDVTEERKMEAVLREREEYLAVTLDSIGEAVIATDAEGHVTTMNDVAEHLTGWDEPDAEGRALSTILSVHNAQTGETVENPVEKVLREGRQRNLANHTVLTARDGTEYQIADSAAPIRAEGGDLLGVVLVFRDVTEEYDRQEQLRRSEQKTRAILNGVAANIAVLDAEGTIVDVNEQWRQFARENDVQNMQSVGVGVNYLDTCTDAVNQEPASLDVKKGIEEVLDGERRLFEYEYPCHGPNEKRWFMLRATPLGGDEEGAVVAHINITERKEAEEQLRLRVSAMEASAHGIVITERDGTITYVNPAFTDLTGYAREEAVGRTPRILKSGEQDPAYYEELWDTITSGEVWRGELVNQRKDGGLYVEEQTITPVADENGEIHHFVAIKQDVTEQKQLEAQLQRAQKMETVGTLAGGIAHDFNNILHAAMAYVELTQEDLPEEHLTQEYLSRTEEGLKQARGLVRKLLTFSRPDRTATKDPVDLAPLVEETLELAEPSFPKGLEVRTDLDEDTVVVADADQLRQVVMNLVTNAGQAMQEAESERRSVLDVRLRRVPVDPDMAAQYLNLGTGRHVHLAVSDTGIGIDPDTQGRIFDPFFTTKTSDGQQGTGLGLSVVHGIVQALDGEITVHSEPGEGTTFNVYLPLASGEIETAPPEGTGASSTHAESQHVLVVDDDESVTDLESIRLSRLGYSVTTCNGAREALDLVRSEPDTFHLILTDYQMPGMTGLDLVRRLREEGVDVPVAMMSGFQAQVSEETARAAGVEAMLQKPVGRDELEDTIRRLTGRT